MFTARCELNLYVYFRLTLFFSKVRVTAGSRKSNPMAQQDRGHCVV